MKKLIIVLIVLTGTATTFAQSSKEKMPLGKSDTTAKYVYTCTMHPEVITDKAGKCPKCGMDLVKKKVGKIYTCTMHPEVISDKPGKCPKCGMDLVEQKSEKNAMAPMQKMPMHKKDSTMSKMKKTS